MPSYELIVRVWARYLPGQSEPEQGNCAFTYTITIRNTGNMPSQLTSRRWVITNAGEQVQGVNDLGVVDHQPLLPLGESLEYMSRTTIKTPVDTMRGEHFCVAEDDHRSEALIPEFALVMSYMLR